MSSGNWFPFRSSALWVTAELWLFLLFAAEFAPPSSSFAIYTFKFNAFICHRRRVVHLTAHTVRFCGFWWCDFPFQLDWFSHAALPTKGKTSQHAVTRITSRWITTGFCFGFCWEFAFNVSQKYNYLQSPEQTHKLLLGPFLDTGTHSVVVKDALQTRIPPPP